jgi:hypothetical protein
MLSTLPFRARFASLAAVLGFSEAKGDSLGCEDDEALFFDFGSGAGACSDIDSPRLRDLLALTIAVLGEFLLLYSF